MISSLNAKPGEIIKFQCPKCLQKHQMEYVEGCKWEIYCRCKEVYIIILKDEARLLYE